MPMAESLVPEARDSRPPARRLSTEQMEAVVRRAIELQARDADTEGDGGITEEEVVRLGRELGITPALMRRAMAEVSGTAPPPAGLGERVFGGTLARAIRTVPGDAEDVKLQIERYLVESQYLAVLRRLPDRTVYEKSSGFQVEFTRVMDAMRAVLSGKHQPRIGTGFDLRTARTVEVSVVPLETGFCHVMLGVDLGNQRTGYWVGVGTAGGFGTVGIGTVAALAVAPPMALVAVPIFGAAAYATRVSYTRLVKRAQLHLEALLDHLEMQQPLTPGALRRP
jgi:hypothetical protein